MLFNSIDFAFFLPIVFLIYWFLRDYDIKLQNLLIVVASYFFYGWWDWRFLLLIFFSTVIDFILGKMLVKENNENTRRYLLWISLFMNLGFLGFFKYYNFFIDNFVNAFSFFGKELSVNSLSIILPVGISFYTFQTLSYTIDVYRGNLKPTKDFIAFTAFVSFFPQLVAGPIERASNLLPQFYTKRKFDYPKAVDGLRQILWGFFKKVVIADGCAQFANEIFNNSAEYNGSTLFIGAIFFTFQIYGDFSGYSDIAIGVSRLFGFDLKQNFAFPYFSRDIAEFWRRWHISLSTWFRDYLYIPLGGSRGNTISKVKNTFIIFIVSGFWHGANWTFIFWGALNALYFLPLLLRKKNRNYIDVIANDTIFPSIKELKGVFTTFTLTIFGWIFFRADNLDHAFSIVYKIFSFEFLRLPYFKDGTLAIPTICFLVFFVFVEWLGRRDKYAIESLTLKWFKPLRILFYYTLLLIILWALRSPGGDFIYFQF